MGRRAPLLLAAVLAAALAAGVGIAAAAAGAGTVSAGGVEVRVAPGWSRVAPAGSGTTRDYRTVLVAGTKGVIARASKCQVAAYRIPAEGAAVVVLARRDNGVDGVARDRRELNAMRLRQAIFECWDGRGAVAQIALAGDVYQVNVLVGDDASPATAAAALAAARSLDSAG